jgi:alkylhydroperoxidase/carboxymuconolactone decarboxylase family protein YurZ
MLINVPHAPVRRRGGPRGLSGFVVLWGVVRLRRKQRQIASIASLVNIGGVEPQLTGHINAGLNVGLTPEEIVDVIIHCVQYAGFPRAINAINVAKKVFEQRGVA